ncbi:MAG: hypothetical protein N0E59_00795 [Candidatus Thiodiazotropha taylori]|nr:hypothetical protein [Candidatus Thiodiazotropha taylori]MCG8109279.1 hypothetical protein [Candidatus Thiodiazotropha taylori]MCW4281617.1 hypothetical protein [Candidatus Thiodiazotropha taylori]MCW4303590.1 hypothetical protein [Candidatus Thiodiazotropha taylori]
MLQIWHDRIDKLPEPLKAEAIKRLNQLALKTRPFIVHTFQQLQAVSLYIHEYGHLLSDDVIQANILNRYTDIEKGIIASLLNCKTDDCRKQIHTTVRNELQRTRRAIISIVDAVLEDERKRSKKKWEFWK